jgi:hypothetical protein
MIKIMLELVGTAECSDITAEILLDQQSVGKYVCSTTPGKFDIVLADNPASHRLSVIMQGKTRQHTKVGADGMIEHDNSITFSQLEFEDIDMMPIFCQGWLGYYHSNNDVNRSVEVDEFYGYMGCNGTVNIEFDTPIYLWFNQHF